LSKNDAENPKSNPALQVLNVEDSALACGKRAAGDAERQRAKGKRHEGIVNE
jgi:hypothetical protein